MKFTRICIQWVRSNSQHINTDIKTYLNQLPTNHQNLNSVKLVNIFPLYAIQSSTDLFLALQHQENYLSSVTELLYYAAHKFRLRLLLCLIPNGQKYHFSILHEKNMIFWEQFSFLIPSISLMPCDLLLVFLSLY